ncbi:MAG: MFS transporter [Actinomycetota bacterium]|nr:MFS transporter [Actinomycetota bacterium]
MTPSRTSGVYAPAYRRLTVGILFAIVVVAFEAIGVITAMPVVARELDGVQFYALAFSAFFTTSLVGMVVAGQLCDRRGPRLPFLVSAAVFALGLVLAAAAPSMFVLVVARAVQGFGGGVNIVAVYVILARAYPEDLRPQAFTVLSSAWVLPSIVGPAVAGWLTDEVSWRWVFLAVLPLLVPAVLLVAPRLAALDTVAPSAASPPSRSSGRRLSYALAAASGTALLQYAAQRLDALSVALGAAGGVLLAVGLPPLLPPGTLRAGRGLPTTVLLRGVLAGAFFGAETFVPLMLVQERELSTTLAGFTLTGAALGWAFGSWFQGRPALRLPRWLLVRGGALLVTGGIAVLPVALLPGVPAGVVAVGWTVAGLGMGLGITTVGVLLLEQSPPAEAGANSAALQVSDAVGSIVGVGAAGAVFAALHVGPARDRPVFLVIWVSMALLAALAAVLAARLVPREPAPADAAGPRAPGVSVGGGH